MSSLSVLFKDLQVAIQTAINVEGRLKDEIFVHELTQVLKIAKKGFTAATGGALHRLRETKPSIDTVKELIQGIPDALSFKNGEDLLPIQSAVRHPNACKYLPILAKEGIKHEIGGSGMRGGLLVVDPKATNNMTTLQSIVNLGNLFDPIPSDTAHLDAMKELRKDNLLLKKDIKDHCLLYWACGPATKMRFEYLAEWDPDCLMSGTFKGLPLSHAIIEHKRDFTSFLTFFQTALKHHPQHLGLLFQKDSSGKTAYERAIYKYEIDETFNVIKQCIPTDTDLPILHHVVRDAPKFMNDFTMRYLSAAYLRDADGRSVRQAAIASGSKTFQNDTMFYVNMTDDEIAELDPVTKQYPFLTCATGEESDLSTVYVLLSRNPSLLEKYTEQTTDEFAEEARSRKRKRDSDNENDGEDEE